MNDARLLPYRKRYAESFDAAAAIVLAAYPSARREGSCGCWYWYYGDGEVVAEMWVHPVRDGWWLRLKPPG